MAAVAASRLSSIRTFVSSGVFLCLDGAVQREISGYFGNVRDMAGKYGTGTFKAIQKKIIVSKFALANLQ